LIVNSALHNLLQDPSFKKKRYEHRTKITVHNQPTAYSYKLKKMGKISELLIYEKPIIVGYERSYETMRKENRTTANEQNAKRAKRAVYDLVNTNLTEYTKMLTLTYAKTVLEYDQISRDFKIFMANLKNQKTHFPYLTIIEHQKKRGIRENNLGSLHMHVICFTDVYLPFKQLKRAWGDRGSVHIEKLDRAKDKGAYVAKYLTKENMPPDKKAYRTSRDIKRPEIYSGLVGADLISETVLEQFNIIEQFEYNIYGSSIQEETGEIEVSNRVKGIKFLNERDS